MVSVDTVEAQDPGRYWHDQFLYALSGLSWAVGKLGDEAGYAGVVHDRLTHPAYVFPVQKDTD